MENFKTLPLEVQLSAYLDGQLEAEDAQAVDERLGADPNARELLSQLKAGSAFGNGLFAQILKEPVPLRLVRAIKDTAQQVEETKAPVRKSANSNVVSFFRFMPQAIAASAVLLLAGGYSGYFIGMKAGQFPTEVSETRGWGDASQGQGDRGAAFNASRGTMRSIEPSFSVVDIANVHDVYTNAQGRLAEIPAKDSDALKTWLGEATGVSFKIPDLSKEGLKFEGGRLVAVNGKPAGGLYFRNGSGGVVAIYIVKGKVSVDELTEGTNAFVGGVKGNLAWFVAGPGTISDVKPLALKVSQSL